MVYTLAIWPLLAAALLLGGIGLYTRRYRDLPAVKPFILFMHLGTWYALTSALAISTVYLPLRITISQLVFISTAFGGPVFLSMVLEYAGHDSWLTPWRLVALLTIPVTTCLLAFTTPLHEFFRYDYQIVYSGSLPILVSQNGPWFWVHFLYSLFTVIIAGVLLLLSSRERISNWNKLALFAAISVQAGVEVLYAYGITPIPQLNPSPVALVILALICLWALLRHRLFGVTPPNHFAVMDMLSEFIVVVDSRNRIVTYNKAAGEQLGLSPGVTGQRLHILTFEWARLLDNYADDNVISAEVTLHVKAGIRFFRLTSLAMPSRFWITNVRVFILYDITELKQLEDANQLATKNYRSAQRMAHVGNWTWHIGSGRLDWSDEMYNIFNIQKKPHGATLAEVLSHSIHPDDRENILAQYNHMMRVRALGHSQFRVIWPDGSLHHIYGEVGDIQADEDGALLSLSGIAQDITQRVATETALRENEAKFRSLFEQSQVGITIFNKNEEFVDANDAYCELLGYTRYDLLKMKLIDIVPPELHPQKGPVVSSQVLTGRSYETFNLHRDGRRIPVEVTSNSLTGSNGLMVSLVRDITERKWAEEIQRESEERYRSLVMYSPDAILVYQHDHITLANFACARLFGADSPEQILGTSLYKLVHPDYHELLRERVFHMRELSEPVPPVRQRIIRIDGRQVDVELSAAPFMLEGEFSIHVILRDITDRLQADMALRESEERNRTLLHMALVAIIVLVDGKIEYSNPAGVRLLGAHTLNQLINRSFLDFVVVERRLAFLERMNNVEQGDEATYPVESRYLRLDGTPVDVHVMASPLVYRGKPAVQIIAADITQRVHAEQQLLEHLRRENRVVELGRELAATLDLDRIFTISAERLHELIDCPNIAIELLDSASGVLNVAYIVTEGERIDTTNLPSLPFNPDNPSDGRSRAIVSQHPVVVNDLLARVRSGKATLVGSGADPCCAIYIPMVAENRVIGLLDLQSFRDNAYSLEDGLWLEGVANLIGLSIQQSRLYVDAQRTAAAEERNRLASELHDAVSQTLFASNLTAETLLRRSDNASEPVRDGLTKLQQLNRGALAEMRTLLMELRPATLLKTRLKVLLEQLATSVSSRVTARVSTNLEDVGQLPPELHLGLYRIAQESLNNVIKHADAQHIEMSLRLNDGIDLQVCDDGCGFDLSSITAEHQGIQIMRERALKLGVYLELSSIVGEGTQVLAHWAGELSKESV